MSESRKVIALGTLNRYNILRPQIKPIRKTWAQLKELRDGSRLSPGQVYRITDYVATTTQADTRSAGHGFDVLVQADDISKLSETAFAVRRDGDTYFAGCKLEAWELKYCLDNDVTRFPWADSTNGKGVVYWMRDEYGNECPYDFKSIQFKRVLCTDAESVTTTSGRTYTTHLKLILQKKGKFEKFFSNSGDIVEDVSFDTTDTDAWLDTALLDNLQLMNDVSSQLWRGSEGDSVAMAVTSGFMVYYRLPGTSQSRLGYATWCLVKDATKPVWLYTFNELQDITNPSFNIDPSIDMVDASLNGEDNHVYGNVIKPWSGGLNNIVMYGEQCNGNFFGRDCRYMEIGFGSSGNYFDNGCVGSNFAFGCNQNAFAADMKDNSFGHGCSFNSIEATFTGNSILNEFQYNIVAPHCRQSNIGGSAKHNHLGPGQLHISAGSNMEGNTIGPCLQEVVIGDNMKYSVLDGYSLRVKLPSGIKYCHVLAGLRGTISNLLSIPFETNKTYPQTAGLNSQGELKVWCNADLIE